MQWPRTASSTDPARTPSTGPLPGPAGTFGVHPAGAGQSGQQPHRPGAGVRLVAFQAVGEGAWWAQDAAGGHESARAAWSAIARSSAADIAASAARTAIAAAAPGIALIGRALGGTYGSPIRSR